MRGRCQRCLRAGEVFHVTRANVHGTAAVTDRLCEHCGLHEDTPAIGCVQCFPQTRCHHEICGAITHRCSLKRGHDEEHHDLATGKRWTVDPLWPW